VGHEEIGYRACPGFIWFKGREMGMEMEMEMNFLVPRNTENSKLTGRPSALRGLF
jgi:hypothetical protein